MATAISSGTPQLISLQQALNLDRETNLELHRRHLNPLIANLFEIIGADTPLTRAEGSLVWDADGVQYLDFLSGFAALNLGHNHPEVCDALDKTRNLCNLIEGLGTAPAALAHNLALLSPERRLQRVCFANSGAEVIDIAIKLARAATGRTRLIACEGGFHGRTMGALSINSRRVFREQFEPLVPDVEFVPYADIERLETALKGKRAAGFIVEPIQGEGGMIVPPQGYFKQARELCSRYGTMLIADEVQTGLGRTGRMFAIEHEDVVPDAIAIGKALGGGVMPISAVLTTEDLWKAAHGGTPRSPYQTPTFGGNTRACAVALATLDVLVSHRLAERATESGEFLMNQLRHLQQKHGLIADVRGRGLMIGIEFAPLTDGLATILTGGLINRLSRDFLTGLFVLQLRQNHRILTLSTLNNPTVLRAQPPLTTSHEQLEEFLQAFEQSLEELAHAPATGLLKHWRLLVRALTA